MTLHPSSSKRPIAAKAEVVRGDVLGGKFRVERILGRGGMGVVIEATNSQLDQRVALKLLATGADDPAVVERFTSEARAAARLRSEHVARVYDVGRDAIHGPFIVMELLEGRTLADLVAASGACSSHRAAEYVIDACEGLAEAHARGIIHQDVKPANLFLVTGTDGRPSIKLLDFGIATMRTKEREADPSSSQTGIGSPAYLAPEQLRGAAVDHRADIWALGCVLYELLVGERPFRATRFTELVTKILETPPHPIPDALELSDAILSVLGRCLEKDPAKRFSSTGALGLALLPFARRRAHASVARAVAHVKSSGLDQHLEMPSSMPPPPSDSATDLPSSGNLRAPSVPRFSSFPVDPGAVAGASAAPPGRRRLGFVLLALAGLLMVGAVLIWTRLAPPVAVTPPPAPSSVVLAPPPSASASVAVAVEPTPPPSASPSELVPPPAAVPAVRPGVGWRPPVGGRPPPVLPANSGATGVASAVVPDSEIRRSR